MSQIVRGQTRVLDRRCAAGGRCRRTASGATYAKVDPQLWGFPFFYWYQLMWVFLSAILVSISYQLVTHRGAQAAGGSGTW